MIKTQVQHRAGPFSDAAAAVFEGGQMSLAALAKLASIGAKAGVGVPLVLGAGLGMAASRIMSPSVEDLKATEKRLELARIRTMVNEHRRKQKVADMGMGV